MSEFKLGPNQNKWLQELRSEKYEKYIKAYGVKYPSGKICACALGVGILSQNNEIFGSTNATIIPDDCEVLLEKDNKGDPSLKLSKTFEELGLKRGFSELISLKGFTTGFSSLVSVNDETDLSLSEIADFIEEHADKIFVESK